MPSGVAPAFIWTTVGRRMGFDENSWGDAGSGFYLAGGGVGLAGAGTGLDGCC